MTKEKSIKTINIIVAGVTIIAQLIFVVYFISEMKHQINEYNRKVDLLVQEAQKNISLDTEQKVKIETLEKCCDDLKKTKLSK